MEDLAPQDQQALQERLEASREKLEGLVAELHGVDRELEALEPERRRFQLLGAACESLARLEEVGAAALFWGEGAAAGLAEQTLHGARGRLDAFQKQFDEIEVRRQAVYEEIERAQEASETLEADLDDARRRAEEKAQEWLIEREDVDFPLSISKMPWARGGEDDRRFRKTLATALSVCLLLGLVFPWIDLPLPEAWEMEEVPDRFTRLIQEEIPLPPPTQVVQETQPEETEPEPVEETVPEEARPETAPQPSPDTTPGSKGILAFREKFSGLAQSDPAAKLGAQAKIQRAGEAAVGRPTRNMVATTAPGSSGGINLASLSRDVGGGNGELAGVQVARATSSIGTGTGSERPLSDGPGLGRTDEEIQIVFDRHKSALYRLYNRELRRDPTLQGQMVLRLTIQPDGSVSLCELKSSDMAAPKLASQVVTRVKTFDFGAKDGISAVTIVYPIDFLPAT